MEQLAGYITALKNFTSKVLEKCFDRIPIYYNGRTMFADPNTRQTFLPTKYTVLVATKGPFNLI